MFIHYRVHPYSPRVYIPTRNPVRNATAVKRTEWHFISAEAHDRSHP